VSATPVKQQWRAAIWVEAYPAKWLLLGHVAQPMAECILFLLLMRRCGGPISIKRSTAIRWAPCDHHSKHGS
jgi:hypothetical protein